MVMRYPPEIVDACVTMEKSAAFLNEKMNELRNEVQALTGSSSAQAVQAFSEAQALWQQSGLAHNEALTGVAKAAGDSYSQVTEFDAHMARQFGG